MNLNNNIKYFALIVLLQPLSALAEEPKYQDIFLHFDTGISLSRNLKGYYENNMGSSYIFGVGTKYQLNNKVKIGVNVSHRPGYQYNHAFDNEYDKKRGTTFNPNQKFKITSLMFNASYDIMQIKDKVRPYIEIGAGISRINNNVYYVNTSTINRTYNGKSTNNLTASALLGASFKLNEKTNINLGYRYTHFGLIKQPAPNNHMFTGKLSANEFAVSLEFKL